MEWALLIGLGLLALPVVAVVALIMALALRRRVEELEQQSRAQQAAIQDLRQRLHVGDADPAGPTAAPVASAAAAAAVSQPMVAPGIVVPSLPAAPPTVAHPAASTVDTEAADANASSAEQDLWGDLPPAPAPAPAAGPDTGRGFQLFDWLKAWFTTGNIPVKVGMLVLFAGVAALLRYASDQGWMAFPLWARLLVVGAASAGALWFGWRQRVARPGFALTVQGGALGMGLLTVFAAYRLGGYLPVGLAFAATLGLLALTVWLALLQDALALAVFGVLGGFLAPLWLSTGAGNHVALFSYYAVLNAAIFALAIRKSWRLLNLLGFVFTFGISILWGVLRYSPADFASAQAFLALFYAMYLALPALAAWLDRGARPPGRLLGIDSVLVFGTPLVAFLLEASLLAYARLPLAMVASGAALWYGVLAWHGRRHARLGELALWWTVLAVAFATLAIPLACSAQATTAVYAVLATALVWLGLRQRRRVLEWLGVGLHVLAFAALGSVEFAAPGAWQPVLNARFLAALLLAGSALASAWCFARMRQRDEHPTLACLFLAWGVFGLLGTLWREVDGFTSGVTTTALHLMLLALLGLAAAAVCRWQMPVRALAIVALLLGVAGPILHWLHDARQWVYPGSVLMALAIAVHVAASRSLLQWLRALPASRRLHEIANTAWWLHAAVAGTLGIWNVLDERKGPVADIVLLQQWSLLPLALPALALAALCVLSPRWLGYAHRPEALFWQRTLARLSMLGLVCAAVPGLVLPGDPAPRPWLPVLNPQDLVLAASLALAVRWWQQDAAALPGAAYRSYFLTLAALALLLWLSKSALAAVHHWAQVPWHVLALMHSALAQATLTLLWGLLAVLAWVLGSRRGSRPLWMMGLAIMGVVLLKLVLFDRHHLGNLWGIASFIGYGLLCVAVGYIAPAPARDEEEPAHRNTA